MLAEDAEAKYGDNRKWPGMPGVGTPEAGRRGRLREGPKRVGGSGEVCGFVCRQSQSIQG